MMDTGTLNSILEDLGMLIQETGEDIRVIMYHTRDNVVHCSVFADSLNAFGDLYFEDNDVASEFIWDEMPW